MGNQGVVPLGEFTRRLAEIAEQMHALEIERAALERMRAKSVPAASSKSSTSSLAQMQRPKKPHAPETHTEGGGQVLQLLDDVEKPGASEAVLALIRSEPHMMPAEAVKRLVGRVSTNAKKEQKMLFQTIANLIRRKRLTKDATGKLIVTG